MNFPTARTLTGRIEELFDGALGEAATESERRLIRQIGNIDILVGGPPCQGHSNLNNHTRRSDPKNALYERMARVAELVKPTHVIIENVSAVLHDRGHVVERTAAALERLGYHVDQTVAEVSTIGVPQTRRRHVLVASRLRRAELAQALTSHACDSRTVQWAIGDLAKTPTGGRFDTPASPTKVNQRRIDYLFHNDLYDLPDSMRPDCHRLRDHSYKSVYGRIRWNEPAQTITTGFTCMGQGRFVHSKARRTLTPHEAARLQFIPDFFRFPGDLGRTDLTRLIGNAVPPKLTYVLVLELLR